MDLFKINEGIIVTKDVVDEIVIENKKINLIPVWLFLLMK